MCAAPAAQLLLLVYMPKAADMDGCCSRSRGVERGSCIVDVPALRPVQKGEPQRPAEAERRLSDQRGHRQEAVRRGQERTHVEGSIVGVAREPALAGSRLRFRAENDQRGDA